MPPLRTLALVGLLALARGAALSGASMRQLTICEAEVPCPSNFVCDSSSLCVPAPSPSPLPVVSLSLLPEASLEPALWFSHIGVTPEPRNPGVPTYPTMMPSVEPNMEPSAPPLPVTQVLPPPVVGTPPPTPSPLPSPTRMPNPFGRLECAACTDALQCATGDCHTGKCVYTDYRFRGSVLKCFGAMGVP